MKRTLIALVVAAFAATGALAAPSEIGGVTLAQVSTTQPSIVVQNPPATYDQPTPPTKSTITIKGGDLAAQILDWFYVAFGGILSAGVMALIYKVFGYFGIKTTDIQRAQLEAVVVNGLSSGAAQAQMRLRATDKLDITSKNEIVNAAIDYTQRHAAETIRALGLDPKSGEAVEAIRARIEKVLNDPSTPTPPAITPPSGQPLAPTA